MRKLIYYVAGALMALSMAACSKDKGGSNPYAYSPNSCMTTGGANRYQYVNGQCRDVQTNRNVSVNLCSQASYGYGGYDPRCNTGYGYNNYGYNNGYMMGGFNTGLPTMGGNACAIYNSPLGTYYPAYLPQMGGYVCVKYTYSMFYGAGYGSPMFYGGYNNVFQGCTPGYSRCNCRTFGGNLGFISAGVSMGICY